MNHLDRQAFVNWAKKNMWILVCGYTVKCAILANVLTISRTLPHKWPPVILFFEGVDFKATTQLVLTNVYNSISFDKPPQLWCRTSITTQDTWAPPSSAGPCNHWPVFHCYSFASSWVSYQLNQLASLLKLTALIYVGLFLDSLFYMSILDYCSL